MRLEDFTAYLAACGIKRFTIEIDDSRLKETAIPQVRDELLRVFEEFAKTQRPVKYAAPQVETQTAPKPPVELTVPRGTEKPVEQPKVEKESTKPVEPVKETPKAETPKEKPVEKAIKAEPAAKAAGKAYDEFLSLVEKDDGGDLKAALEPVVARLALDEMLRINIEFGLGLDTDKPTDKIRQDIIECW